MAAGRRAASSFLPASRTRRLLRRLVIRASHVPGIDRMVAGRIEGQDRPVSPKRRSGEKPIQRRKFDAGTYSGADVELNMGYASEPNKTAKQVLVTIKNPEM